MNVLRLISQLIGIETLRLTRWLRLAMGFGVDLGLRWLRFAVVSALMLGLGLMVGLVLWFVMVSDGFRLMVDLGLRWVSALMLGLDCGGFNGGSFDGS